MNQRNQKEVRRPEGSLSRVGKEEFLDSSSSSSFTQLLNPRLLW